MKITSIIFVTLAMVVASVPAFGQDLAKQSFYQECIDKTVAKYERKSLKVDSDRPAIRRDAAVATLKASFYKSHKEQLINQMVIQDLDTKSGEMNYFLVKSFGNFMEENLDQAIADVLKIKDGRLHKEDYEAYSQEKQQNN